MVLADFGGTGRGGSPTPYDLDKHIRNVEDSGQSHKSCFLKLESG